MNAVRTFEASLSPKELKFVRELDRPVKIQAFLDSIPYSAEEIYRCPQCVLRDRMAHCFDGALFAAAALRRLGHPPLVVDMLPERDDEHMLAIYKRDGFWGAVAKSNFVGLRFREPVYKSLRELVMSYFELYYNVEAEKTLRGYTVPLNLTRFDRLDWMTSDQGLDSVAEQFGKIRKIYLLTPAMAAELSLVDRRSYDSGLMGVNEAGLYRPDQEGK